MRSAAYIVCLLICTFSAAGQLVFTKIPKNMQLFARDSDNFGRFVVTGKTKIAGTVKTALVEMITKDVLETFSQDVDSGGTFNFPHKVPAGLHEYNLEVYISDPVFFWQKVEEINHLVAGDFFIVAGQSNAVCGWASGGREHDSLHFSPFNRAIGGNFTWATDWYPDFSRVNYPIEEDCLFGLPSSYLTADFYFTYSGIWPIQLQYELVKQTGIPICVVNGSAPGTSIAENMASHTPSLPDSLHHSAGPFNKPPAVIYDRLFKKLYTNDATRGVKGIFWYQGETDGTYDLESAMNYENRFRKLYNSWKADYPNVKKIFVMQLNTGCGGNNLGVIREVQRKLPESYTDVVVMSSVGNPITDRSPDGCHYTVPGYAHIADKLLPLAKKYLYDFPLSDLEILPANIQKAYYTNSGQICIEFDKNIVAEKECLYPEPAGAKVFLKDYFFRQGKLPVSLLGIESKDNKLFLNFKSDESIIGKITYLPDIYSNLPSLYSGPWILTENNPQLGAYSFYEFPVETLKVKEIPVQVQEFKIFPNPGKQNFEITFAQDGQHTLILCDLLGKTLLKAETSNASESVDTTPLPAGVYILRIDGADGVHSSKIVLEK